MNTNTQQKAPGACDSEGLHTNTNSVDFRSHGPIQQSRDGKEIITRLKTVYLHIKDAVSGFYLHRGVGIETIAMLIMVAVFGAVRVFQ
jgi:hypothetical protein